MANPCVIICGDGKPQRPQGAWRKAKNIHLRIGDTARDIHLHLDRLHESLHAISAAILTDLLEIAAYVYGADQVLTRGGTKKIDYGDSWLREMRFEIPVRCPEIWQRTEITAALSDCLQFLLDDQKVEFGFRAGKTLPKLDAYLFDDISPAGNVDADEVVLFSGGIDSLAGALGEINNHRKAVLVSHRSVSKVASRQDGLVQALRKCAPSLTLAPRHVSLSLNKGKEIGREFTQRSRSFVFAVIAALVARTFGLNRIRFYENGVTSINLPISPQVIGGRASRTTHPKVLRSFERLFTLLFEEPFAVENPLQWKTKTEVLQLIKAHGQANLIARSVSCVKTKEQTIEHSHCGRCSQCVDRRLAAIAAGLTDSEDPRRQYASDVLTGSRDNEDLLLIERYCGTAIEIGAIRDHREFMQRFPEVATVCRAFDFPAEQALQNIFELFRRHALQLSAAISQSVAEHAAQIASHELDPNCLISLVCSRLGGMRRRAPSTVIPSGSANGNPACPVHIRPEAFEIEIDGKVCELRDTVEFRLFEYLWSNRDRNISHDELGNTVWKDRSVQAHSYYRAASTLRRLLRKAKINSIRIDGGQDGYYRIRWVGHAPSKSARHQLHR